ncbi:MAG: transcriptional repressor [Candidatus Heimdallarchaeota archaeon]|nr:MAG: transcriptional repressor [Candidatus Heimdallarchaeota archaeon]
MRETGSKVTANNDKITISFDRKIRLGPLHTLVEGYLQLTRDQQKQVEYLMESFLLENDLQEDLGPKDPESLAINTLTDLKTKKDRILNIVRNRANPNYLTAREIQELYQHYIRESIGISTIQTNLNRLVDAGFVERQEGSNPIEYRINPKKAHEIPKVML